MIEKIALPDAEAFKQEDETQKQIGDESIIITNKMKYIKEKSCIKNVETMSPIHKIKYVLP